MGLDTALSEDGKTLVAAIDTDQSGGVEVFRKLPTGWAYETRLLADPKEAHLMYEAEPALAVSGDGSLIALGVDVEVRPGANPEDQPSTGAVYLFRRGPGGWIREQKLTFPDSMPEDRLGWRVDLDESGTLLAAWRRFGDSPDLSGQVGTGVVELYRRSASGWNRVATVPAVDDTCHAIGLSGDGQTLVRSCSIGGVEILTAPTWQRVASLPNEVFGMNEFSIPPKDVAVNHDGSRFAVRSVTLDDDGAASRAWVNVFRRDASGWTQEASLGPGASLNPGPVEDPHGGYGLAISMSRDGQFLAVGASGLGGPGPGVNYPPGATDEGRGVVFVYQYKPSGWYLRQTIHPNANPYSQPLFGWSVSFGRNHKDLAVGAPWDASNADGVGGDQADASAPFRGAVWLY
jgi:hypothetical protein